MSHISKIIVLFSILFLNLTSFSLATDMSQGLQCPPGWNDNRAARGNDLIKQCISPSQDAFIELYAAPGQEVPFGKLLDAWTQEMTQRGLPFQNIISEQPGQVSGYPAVTRVYSGHTREGNQFDSSLVASRYNGVNYVFQGLSLKGREQARQEVRKAMNTWYYPGTAQQGFSSPQGGLPLGSGNSANTPYGNDPYSNQQTGAANSAMHGHNANSGNSQPTIVGTFIADKKDYWGGHYYYRMYQFFSDGTFISGNKNAATGKIDVDSHKKSYKISKSGNNFTISSGKSCTDGYVTDTESNSITRFKSGCYSSGGKAIYFRKIPGNLTNMGAAVNNTNSQDGKPTLTGLFIADKKDYFGGRYYLRMYQYFGDGTYLSGNKDIKTGKIDMSTNRSRYKLSKSGKSYAIQGSETYCTQGWVTKIQNNAVTRFKSGCYSSGGKKMYFYKIKN